MAISDNNNDISMENNLRIVSRLVYHLETSFHPVIFSQVLIRLGHEPQPPRLAHTHTSFVGLSKPVYMYPWIGSYIWNLIRSLGLWQSFTVGLPCSFLSSVLMTGAEEAAFRSIQQANLVQNYRDDSQHDSSTSSYTERDDDRSRRYSMRSAFRFLTTMNSNSIRHEETDMADMIDLMAAEPSSLVYMQHLLRLLLWRGYGIVVSHPFRVVMVRQMAYAVCGGETPYEWLPQAFRQVYRVNGFAGFFQGLVPTLLADLLVFSSVISIYRVLRLYLFRDFDPSVLHSFRSVLWMFHNHYVQEPLRLVGDLMTVRGAGLSLPTNPAEVASDSWVACWNFLRCSDQLLRGSNWFIRRRISSDVLKSLPEAAS